jgi:hypothetical protein
MPFPSCCFTPFFVRGKNKSRVNANDPQFLTTIMYKPKEEYGDVY